MKTSKLIYVAAVLATFGCGGGIDSSKTLGSLSTADQMTECNHLASEFPKKTVDCGSGATVTVGTDPAACSGSNFTMIP